jgi:hypothetical protein
MNTNIVTPRRAKVARPETKEGFAHVKHGALRSLKIGLIPAVLLASVGMAMAQPSTEHARQHSMDRCLLTSQPWISGAGC